ncbi:MAG: metal dependent phosphohydrolase [Clostridia bacterium]|jgi:putative nucleotidyltransferase with HDIG domain|nr:metal dependent phosphohydrolase [Clostridia bacterium]
MIDLKQIFEEFDKHLMEDDMPSKYFEAMLKQGLFYKVYPFTMLGDLIKTPQSLQHHPEGNVWNHTMMVVDRAAKHRMESCSPRNFMWAALLHDLGKPDTTKTRKGKVTSYDHDKLGEKLAVKFLTPLTEDKVFINAVAKMVRWHMQTLFVVKDMAFADVKTMLQQVKLEEIALLSLCDRLGRGKMTQEKEAHERANIEQFIQKSRASEADGS